MNVSFLELTRKAAFAAAKAYFNPFRPLGEEDARFETQIRKRVKASSDVSRLLASEVTYDDIDHLRSLRNLIRQLDKRINIDITFAREDLLYAKLLSEVLESKKIKTRLNKSWVKKVAVDFEKDLEVVIWSRNYLSKENLRNVRGSSKVVPYIAMVVDKSELSLESKKLYEDIDVSGASVSDAASSLIQKASIILQRDVKASSSQT